MIGLVSKRARVGDFVCILHGISTPCVLPKVGDRYEYIGQCYVDGIMYGETVDWAEHQADDFTLM
jgi:hypothetical protein